ncbi:MAG: glycosyltransferase, partial [Candidatus Omnitrophica bacterium]|nr:glycosyltransferase [Candidatus Omnitrophota bacterium]
DLSQKSIVIASYTHTQNGIYTTLGGPALAVKKYLLEQKIKRLVCIWQPLPISDTLSAIEETFERGVAQKNRRFFFLNWPFGRGKEISLIYFLLKFRDIFATFYFMLTYGKRFDVFIGVESLDTIIGIVLRKIGLVKTVIYYNLDYGVVRFRNKFLNFIFHAWDKFSYTHADYTWNLAQDIINIREKRYNFRGKFKPPVLVPIGIDLSAVHPLENTQIERKVICYLGVLAKIQGVDLIIEALPQIIKAEPNVKLVILGSGPLEAQLKEEVKNKNLFPYVQFCGVLSDEEVNRVLCKSAIGLAPYFPDPRSTKIGSDPTKPKLYLACGLPVVITTVPPIAQQIKEGNAGVVIDYKKEDLARAVIKLLKEDGFYFICRDNAFRLGKTFDWVNILNKAFSHDY